MKPIIFFTFIFLFAISAMAQRNIETMYLLEAGFLSSHVIPNEIKMIKTSNYEIEFEIINPELLNSFFDSQIGLNGQFEYKYFMSSAETFFEKRRQRVGIDDYDYKSYFNQEEYYVLHN
jgi:hypothetical protein